MFYISLSKLLVTWLLLTCLVAALPRAKEYRNTGEVVSSKNGIAEPTCEQLKAMWRFSKRQSRAAEITNEIPMYRDPFADNVWEPYYATSRSIGGMRLGAYRGKPPIYGRVLHNPPERHKAFEEMVRFYGIPSPRQNEPRRRLTTFRLSGGGHLPALGFPPQQGSFQHLKELIKTERARELQQQRIAEEAAARAALKDLARNEEINRPEPYEQYEYGGEKDEEGEASSGIISFPDLLAPPARPETHMASSMARFAPDYSTTRAGTRVRTYNPTMFDPSSFNNGYNGYII